MFRVDDNEIYIYDVIGPTSMGYIGNADVFDALVEIGKTERVIVHINSPGGSVDEGVGIYNLLKNHPGKVDVIVDSLAASIASVIAMAGETITMTKGSKLMIHEPWTVAMGNSKALRKQADLLDLYQSSIIKIYEDRAKLSRDEIISLLEAETWMEPEQAIAVGFADSIKGCAIETPAVPQNAFQNVPEGVREVKLEKPSTKHRDHAKILAEIIRLRSR